MVKTDPLSLLALRYRADKCPQRGVHTYTPYYYDLLKNKRQSTLKVLEIGIGKGASLKMWRDFFPKAKIYGVDYRKDLLFEQDRIESILCDQRRREHLWRLIDYTGTDIDLVIDDGSHRPRDQIFTCLTLMPLLNKRVTYIIEDVSDSGIITRFRDYDVEVPTLTKLINRHNDNRLVVVRHKSTPSKEIVFYTDNLLKPKIANAVQAQLRRISTEKGIPIISSSLEPMPYFGTTNIFFPHLKRSHRAMFIQILSGIEKSTADIIYFCEHDVLYHPTHFDFIPPKVNKFYYNQNWWMLRLTDGHAVCYDACKLSTLCAYRKLLVDEYKRRHRTTMKNHNKRWYWREPGINEKNYEIWKSAYPVLDIRHDHNLTASRWTPSSFRNKNECNNWQETNDEIPGWGNTKEIVSKLK